MARRKSLKMLRLLFLWLMSKSYNVLADKLPDFITLYGEKYPVFTSFKNWIKISILAETKGLSDCGAVAEMLKLCYRKKLPPNIGSAIMGMLAFLNGDTEFFVSPKGQTKRLYSFSQDSDAIYSSFYAKYRIDLAKSNMHWYKFCALFSGLADENPFATLVRIRTTDETEFKNAKSRRKVMELKAKYGLNSNVEINVAENISSLF